MIDKRASLNKTIAELKGIGGLVSEEIKPTPSDDKIEELRAQVEEKKEARRQPFEKKAGRSTLDVYADLVQLTKMKLGVDDSEAREIASTVISKAIVIQRKYNMSLNEASSEILDEMAKQMGKGQIKVDKGMVSYQKQDREIYKDIQVRIKDNFDVTQGESELYTKLVKENVEDFSVQFRGISKERIANAIVDVAIQSEDITTIRGFKSSPFLENALRMELGV